MNVLFKAFLIIIIITLNLTHVLHIYCQKRTRHRLNICLNCL